tara:strand:+ start:314 stop:490 length:177 start_codon:yes stop_codon:yes gene_type:complete
MNILIAIVFIGLVATFTNALISICFKAIELLMNSGLLIVKMLGWLTGILMISWGISLI